MNLAINLNNAYTKIGYLLNGNYIDIVSAREVPTAFTYSPTSDNLIFGNKNYDYNLIRLLYENPSFKLGSFSLTEIFFQFFLFLDRKYLAPNGLDFTSVSLSVPSYFNLKARQIIYSAINKVYPSAKIYLIAEPAAALIGYKLINENSPLKGDILIIDVAEKSWDFSFATFSPNINTLVIEKQLSCELNQAKVEKLTSYFNNQLITSAKNLGLYDYTGWKLDYVLLAGEELPDGEIYNSLTNLLAPLPIIKGAKASLNTVQGLAVWPKMIDNLKVKIIYPFNFYIQTYVQETNAIEYIPFDTNNLELDITKSYKICTLPLYSPYNLANKQALALFKIYEIALDHNKNELDIKNLKGQEIRLSTEIPPDYVEPTLDVILDFATNTLSLDYTATIYEEKSPIIPETNLEHNLDWLILSKFTNNLALQDDLANFLEGINFDSSIPLTDELALLKYKLLTLLNYIA